MPQEQQHKQRHATQEDDSETIVDLPASSGAGQEILDDIDDLLGDIDSVLAEDEELAQTYGVCPCGYSAEQCAMFAQRDTPLPYGWQVDEG